MIEKITNQNQIARHKLAEKINELIDAVNVLQAQVAILEEHAHPTAKTPEDKGYIKLETPEDKGYIKLDNDSLQKFLKAHPEYNNNGVIEIPKKEHAQADYYWYKQQERYKAALVLIRDLTGAGMSYHDIVIEMREIAKWALDPDYKPLLIGRYSKDDQELFDTLRETKGGDNE